MQKTTLVPIYRATWDLPQSTYVDIGRGISFENVQNVLKPESFELWREYVSEEERKNLAQVRFALMHRFSSSEHVGPEETKSVDLMYRAFICLRLIKPTRIKWANIQYKDSTKGIDVFSFTHPGEQPPLLPESEAFNEVTLSDIQLLARLLSAFLEVVDNGPMNVRRAINHVELGYAGVHDPTIQFITWMMALEQLYSTGDEPLERSALIRRISESVNLDEDIYGGTQFREFYPHLPVVTAREKLRDLFVLRTRFVHGLWVKPEWLEPVRTRIIYEKTSYADMLREVVSWLVRKSLLHYIETAAFAKR